MRTIFGLVTLIVVTQSGVVESQQPDKDTRWTTGAPVTLFDGRSLDRWVAGGVGSPLLPAVINGAMQLTPSNGWIRTQDVYRSFHLTFGYRAPAGASARVFIRTWSGRIDDTGMPINGSGATLYAPDIEWRRADIRCYGNRMDISVDGDLVETIADIKNPAGHIGFWAENGLVEIRDVVLTPVQRDMGDKARRSQVGVVLPRVISDVNPEYTADSMRERIQGVVLADGSVEDVRVVDSLDAEYGLDNECIRALKQWRFEPGTRDGVPVPVRITVDMTFTLQGGS